MDLHEFAIWGPRAGRAVLDLIAAVDVRVISVFHTLLPEPSRLQRANIEGLAA